MTKPKFTFDFFPLSPSQHRRHVQIDAKSGELWNILLNLKRIVKGPVGEWSWQNSLQHLHCTSSCSQSTVNSVFLMSFKKLQSRQLFLQQYQGVLEIGERDMKIGFESTPRAAWKRKQADGRKASMAVIATSRSPGHWRRFFRPVRHNRRFPGRGETRSVQQRRKSLG